MIISRSIQRSSVHRITPQDPELRATGRILDYCRQLGADTYHNLIGGMELYSFKEFEANGLKLAFIESIPVPYPQSSDTFIFRMSIIDVIMNNSAEDIQRILKSYKLITGPVTK